jgi:uncharacterized protein
MNARSSDAASPAASSGTVRHVPGPASDFRPAWWLPGPHLQTLGGALLRPRGGVRFRRTRIRTDDGDFLDLDAALPAGVADGATDHGRPVVLVLHGLEGSSRSPAALQAVRALDDAGISAVVLNFRSCSGERNRAARFYHAGETGDLHLAIRWLAERYPGSPRAALGYSLGGNVLLKYLGEQGDAAVDGLQAAVAVSVPFDLAAGAALLGRGVRRLYGHHFLRSLRRKYAAKHECIDPSVLGAVRRSRTIREFDAAATAPLHGFRDVDHYYGESSAAAWLGRVRIPTLLIHALDDPFLPPDAVPHAVAGANPWITARFTDRGGHMGFVAGSRPWSPRYWAEGEAARYLADRIREAPPSSATQIEHEPRGGPVGAG